VQTIQAKHGKVLSNKILLLILVVVSLLVYGNTLNNGYALDDVAVVTKNAYVQKGVAGIPELLYTPYLRGFKMPATDTIASNDLYRPLPLVTFALEKQLFDNSAAIAHLINILLFAACVCVLFTFLLRLMGDSRTMVAFVACLLFAVHPIHTEVVANVKSRDELLCFFFAFSAPVLYSRYAVGGKTWELVAGTLIYFLSLLSKETSFTFLAIVPLVFFFYQNGHKRRSIYVSLTTVIGCVVFLVLRYAVLGAYNASHTDIEFIDNPLTGATSQGRYATALLVLGHYLKLLILPYPLISDYTYNTIPFVTFGNAWVLLSIGIYLGLLATAVYRLKRYRKDIVAFGILFFLITIALFSNLLFLVGSIMAERFLFFPSAGLCIVAAAMLSRIKGKHIAGMPTGALATVIVVCIAFSGIAIGRNPEWKDNMTLFGTDVQKAPQNARLWHSLGFEKTTTEAEQNPAQQAALIAEGIADIQKALAIYPRYANAHNTLAGLYIRTQQYDSAEIHARVAVELKPTDPVLLSGLGYVYFVKQQYRQTIAFCKQALVYDPGNAAIWDNIAICYQQLKEPDSAAAASQEAARLRQGNAPLH
jgi:tetratricopeptide (TPR) repeat protein